MWKRTGCLAVLAATIITAAADAAVPLVGQPATLTRPSGDSLRGQPSERAQQDVQYRLSTNWDWQQDYYQINHGDGLEAIGSPWFGGVPGIANDPMEPSDGWVLVVRDFGDAFAEAPQIPFFVLYNRYTGYLRFFAYTSSEHLDETYTSAQIELRFDGTSPTKNLYGKALLDPIDRHDTSQVEMVLTPGLQSDGWLFADFEMNYDPDVANVSEPIFAFSIYGLTSTDVDLDGTVNLTQEQKGMTNTPGASLGANDIINGVTKARSQFDKLDDIPDWAHARADSQKNEFLKSKLESFANTMESMPWVPFVGTAFSLLDTFTGKRGSSSKAPTYIIDGELDITGTFTTEDFVATVLLRVPGADHGSQTNYLPVDYDIPLGVFSISGVREDPFGRDCLSGLTAWVTDLDGTPLNLNVNPAAGIVVKEATAAWAFPARDLLSSCVNQYYNGGDYILTDSSEKYNQYWKYRTRFFDFEYFKTHRFAIPYTTMTYPGWSEVLDAGLWTIPLAMKVIYGAPGSPAVEDGLWMKNYDILWPTDPPDEWPAMTPDFVLPDVVDLAPGTTVSSGERLVVEAKDVIQGPASGTYSVENGGELLLHAGEEVTLLPGFTATSGSTIRAHLGEPSFDESTGYGAAMIRYFTSGTFGSEEPSLARTAADSQPTSDLPADRLAFSGAHPNPSLRSEEARMRFSIPERSTVSLTVYDVLGREVASLIAGSLPSGAHSYVWDGRHTGGDLAASGVYFVRLTTSDNSLVRKLVRIQ